MSNLRQMLKTQIALELTPPQLTELQPLILKATITKSIICGSVEIEKGVLKLAAVDRETALEIEKIANTRGEENVEGI